VSVARIGADAALAGGHLRGSEAETLIGWSTARMCGGDHPTDGLANGADKTGAVVYRHMVASAFNLSIPSRDCLKAPAVPS